MSESEQASPRPVRKKPRRRGNGEGTIAKRIDRRERKDGTIVETARYSAAVTLRDGSRKFLYGKTREDVRDKLARAIETVRAGRKIPSDRLTVAAFLDQWLEDSARPKLKPTTYHSYERLIRTHIKPALGARPLARLAASDVQTWLNETSAAGLSPRTCQYLHAILRAALNRARKWQLIGENVALLVDPPRGAKPEIHPLSPADAAAFLAASSGHLYEHLYAFLLASGLRLGEALALRWEDVDMDARQLRVRHTLERLPRTPWRLAEPKSASGRRAVPLIGPALVALRAQRARQAEQRLGLGPDWHDFGFVFTSTVGTPLDGPNVYHHFKAILSKLATGRYLAAGEPHGPGRPALARWLLEQPDGRHLLDHRLHDLRHSTATYLLAAGVPARVVMELLGHSQISLTLNTYSHVLPTMLDDAAARLEAVFPTAAAR